MYITVNSVDFFYCCIYLHFKSGVRFVHSIISHGFLIGHGGKWSANGTLILGPGVLQQALDQSPDPRLIHKRHLYIHLKGRMGHGDIMEAAAVKTPRSEVLIFIPSGPWLCLLSQLGWLTD